MVGAKRANAATKSYSDATKGGTSDGTPQRPTFYDNGKTKEKTAATPPPKGSKLTKASQLLPLRSNKTSPLLESRCCSCGKGSTCTRSCKCRLRSKLCKDCLCFNTCSNNRLVNPSRKTKKKKKKQTIEEPPKIL